MIGRQLKSYQGAAEQHKQRCQLEFYCIPQHASLKGARCSAGALISSGRKLFLLVWEDIGRGRWYVCFTGVPD
jgi:hypothetical protein